MKAVITNGNMDIEIKEIPTPRPGPGEVLVKVEAAGICGSDVPRVLKKICPVYPTILGHEFCGTVAEVGNGVVNLAPGRRVVGIPLVPCFACDRCNDGYYGQCRNFLFLGTKLPGAMAEYLLAKERNLFPLRDAADCRQGAMFEPATVALHAILALGYDPGRPVAVIGCGTIGLLAVQCLRALGRGRIVAVDLDETQLKRAADFGADACFNTGDSARQKSLMAEEFPQILECVGVPSTVRLALHLAAVRARIMLVGLPSVDVVLSPADFDCLSRRELCLKGSWMSYSKPFPGQEWEMVDRFFAEGKFRVEELLEQEVRLEDIPDIFRQINAGRRLKGKVLAHP